MPLLSGAGLGSVGEECQAGVGGEVESVVGQVKIADDGMAEVLDAGVVKADVVRSPAGAKCLALWPPSTADHMVAGGTAHQKGDRRHSVR